MASPSDLGPLEMRVLGLLDGPEPRSVQDIQAQLARGGADLAYTTVMTVLVRLHDKGLVTRTKDGRRFLYAPAKRAASVVRDLVARLGGALFPHDRTRPILTLIDEGDLSDAELEELRKKIDEKLKKKAP
ncbi:MAG: BlaI/MecI/CopY family transcriptional regulator [Myxococcales bacterium]|nr:BlaI/MecI/CopY family transcriptional regulator [Myxococcales bacterium]